MTTYTYGPVPSRRLGFSLGIDIIPFKHCTFDCIYCQLGKTTCKTMTRSEYTPADDIINEVKHVLIKKDHIDYLTVSGSGEPTLHTGLGSIIGALKKHCDIPVAVLTNGSLLSLPQAREALRCADVVAPTLCAATDEALQRINRPVPGMILRNIVGGLIDFRNEYPGNIWLEVMLVHTINDSDDHIHQLADFIRMIRPDKIHLNTVVRPPSDRRAHAVPETRLHQIRNMLGEGCEIIASFKKQIAAKDLEDKYSAILNVIKRRPVTLEDIARVTGMRSHEILKYLTRLMSEEQIRLKEHQGRHYYERNEEE